MKKLNYYAPICGTGYGLTSYHILKNLKNFYDITLFSIGNIDLEQIEDYKFCNSILQTNKEQLKWKIYI